MNLRRLHYFIRVASEGSLSRTARAHGVAQPALTRQIQLLEAELGVQLFERMPRGLRLTEVGQYLKDALELPLNEIETAIRNIRSYPMHIKASLTIGLPPIVSGLMGAQLVARLRRELPNIALRIIEGDSSKLASDLARRLIDVAILVSVVPEQRVSQVRVLAEKLLLVGRPDARPLQEASIELRALAQLPLILPASQSGLRIILERAAETAGTKIVPAMVVDSLELTKQLVGSGEFYTILPVPAFREEADRGELAGITIAEPFLTQTVLWAVKPDWRLPRIVFNELERIVFEEWYDMVTSGVWPGEWIFDFSVLSIPFRSKQAVSGDVSPNASR